MKKPPIAVECIFCGQKDAAEILLQSFRLFLTQALGEPFPDASHPIG